MIGGPESWLDTSAVYGPTKNNPPKRAYEPWECEKVDVNKFAEQIKDMNPKKKLVSEHINTAVDEIKAARAAAFEDIKNAADLGDTKEIAAILDMIEDLEAVQERLEAWQS